MIPELAGWIFISRLERDGGIRWYACMRWVVMSEFLTADSPEEIAALAEQYEAENPDRAKINQGIWN